MYFSEPSTDLHADSGETVGVDFNVATGVWRLRVNESLSRDTLGQMVRYLHDQFYPGEDDYLADWQTIANGVLPGRSTTITLKTLDRL